MNTLEILMTANQHIIKLWFRKTHCSIICLLLSAKKYIIQAKFGSIVCQAPMTAKYSSSNVLLKTGLLLLTATIIGLFFATQSYLHYIYRDGSANFARSVSVSLPLWYGWALFVPVIIWLAKRFPLASATWVRNVSIHFGIGIAITLLKLFIVFTITDSVAWLPSRSMSISQFHPNYVTYWVIVGLSHASEYYRKYRERELHSSQLETRLARAQLQVLKMQLQPHFLFNTLHGI